MRPLRTATVVIFMLCAAALATDTNQLAASSPAKAPHIVFDKTECDLGILTNAESITATFVFQNKGDADLHVKVSWGNNRDLAPVPPGEREQSEFVCYLDTPAER